ncbi:hypothetical protein PoB_004945300 [Plakobranchus ocellatus]|uniref:Uncharacterized protein n=1 Tax=Plakobranchus ocellatus TaxID=259542 RepID=A0AAV4BVV6_9GAST|nr:hypothetical protein PoB_004945300 [Plakobranchus ocellatus]
MESVACRKLVLFFILFVWTFDFVETQNIPCVILNILAEVVDCGGINFFLCYILGVLSLVFQCQFVQVRLRAQ